MLKKKYHQSRPFTLIEILAAMSIFLILSLIMMRFFNSTQKIFRISSQRNSLYSDARIALDIISNDLQCSMYNNETVNEIYPFWFQKINDLNAVNNSFYPESNDWTCLNFIASTPLKPPAATSNICEMRYTFVPMGAAATDNASDPGKGLPDGLTGKFLSQDWQGWLVRSCTGNKIKLTTPPYLEVDNPQFNFYNLPISGFDTAWKAWRLNAIWVQNAFYNQDTNKLISNFDMATGTGTDLSLYTGTSSFSAWQKVIPNVVRLKFTCFWFNPATNKTETYPPLELTGSPPAAAPALPEYGTTYPRSVKIELSLLGDTDWREWITAISNGDNSGAAKILQQKMRTFSKTVYMPKKKTL